jgi:glycine dehydrogenase subunit 2
MVQSLDRSQGRAGGVAADATTAPATFTGNRALQIEEPLIFEMGQPGRCGVDLPEPPKVKDRLNGLRRSGEIGLPGLSEPQVVQHYTRLSQKNYAIDMGVYPLGSCTMKHNPRLNEKIARLPGIGDLHPLQPVSTVQGALELIDRLAHLLKTLTGMPAVAMSPAAGAHGAPRNERQSDQRRRDAGSNEYAIHETRLSRPVRSMRSARWISRSPRPVWFRSSFCWSTA